MNASSILQIENTVLICLFVAVLVILLLSFLRGLLRGWRYGTYHLGWTFLWVIIGLACLTPIANAIGSISLAYFIGPSMTITVSNQSITFNVDTILGTIKNAITQLVQTFSPSTSPDGVASLATSLALSIIKLLTIFTEGIVIATVVNLLGLILWHAAFKRVIPAEIRKETYKKGKLISAFEDFVVTAVVGAMILFPLSSMLNSLINGFTLSTTAEEREKIKANDATSALVVDAANTYNESVFAKAFFYWNANSEGYSFDQSLMNWLAEGDYNDMKVSFIKELQSVSKIATLAVETGILNQNITMAEKELLVIQSEYTPRIISALAGSDIVCGLIPYVLEIGTNIDTVKKYVGNKFGIDYFGADWSGSLKNLAEIFSDVQKSSVLNSLSYKSEDGKLHYDITDTSIADLFTDANAAVFDDIFARISSNNENFNVINKLLLAYAMNQVANSTSSDTAISIADFFPELTSANFEYDSSLGCNIATSIPDSYSAIDFGAEIKTVYHSLAKLNKIDPSFLTLGLSAAVNQQFSESDIKKMTAIAIDNIDSISSVITGEDASGKITTDDNGYSADKEVLLDSTIAINALPKLFKLTESALNSALSATVSVDAANTELFGAKGSLKEMKVRMVNGKNEVSSFLKVIKHLSSTEEGKNLLKNTDSLPGLVFKPNGDLYYISDGVLNALSVGVKDLDGSKIASAILPTVLKKYLSGSASPLASLNLPVELNFDCENLGSELSNLLKMYGKCEDLITYVTSISSTISGDSSDGKAATTRALKGLKPYLEDSEAATTAGTHDSPLYTLLDSFSTSKILNPDTTDSSGKTVSNQNYVAVVNKVFSSLGDSYKFTGTVTDTASENSAVVSIMSIIVNSDSIGTLLSGGSTIDIGALSGIDFEELLSPLDDSTMLSSIFVKFLDDKVLPSLLGDNSTVDVSFTNVDNWKKEGQSLNTLVKAAADIGDLSNIDFLASDPASVTNIIDALSSNPMFYKTTDSTTTPATKTYLFSDFFYERFVTSLDEQTIAFFTDRNTTATAAKDKTTQLKADFDKLDESGWSDESVVLGSIIASVQDMGGLTSLEGGVDYNKITSTNISALLNSLSESESIGRVLSYHAYEKIVDNLTNNGIVLGSLDANYGNTNLDYVWDSFDYTTEAEKATQLAAREEEFGCLTDLLTAVLAPNYGLLKEDSSGNKTIDATSLSLNDVSGEYLLKPVLSALASSHVFNSLPTSIGGTTVNGVYPTGGTTVDGTNPTAFESEISHLISDSKIYGEPDAIRDGETKTNKELVTEYVLEVDGGNSRLDKDGTFDQRKENWAGANGEIWALGSLVDDSKVLKDSDGNDLDFANFNINKFFSSSMSEFATENNRAKLEVLLDDVNESTIMYRLLAIKITETVTDSAGSFSGYGITNDNINSSYLNKHNNADVQSEISALTYVIKGALVNDLGTADITKLSTPEMELTVKKLSGSYVFNTLDKDSTSELTAFETIMKKMVNDAKVYGEPDTIEDGNTKANKVLVGEYVGAVDTVKKLDETSTTSVAAIKTRLDIVNNSKWSTEVERIFKTISLANDSDLDFNNLDLTTYLTKDGDGNPLTVEGKNERRTYLSNILSSINDSKILYRCLSYQVDKNMKGGSYSGLDFSNANTAYLDTYSNDDVKSELDNLTFIMQDGTSVDFNNADIKILNDENTKDLIFRMSGSYVFNTINEANTTAELTSFEGVVKKMLSESTLYGAVDDETVQSNVKGYVASVDTTRVLTDSSVSAIKTRLDYESKTAPVSLWGKELKDLIDTSDSVTDSGLDLKNLDLPTYLSKDDDGNPLTDTEKETRRQNLEDVLVNMNKSELLYRSLPIQMKKAMTGGSYSGLNFDNANTEYLNVHNDSGVQAEIKNLTYIMQEATSVDFNNASIDTLRDTTTQDLLKRMSGSYVFNTVDSSAKANTSFEGIFEKLVSTAGIYKDSSGVEDTDASTNHYYVRSVDGNRVIGSIGTRLDYASTGDAKSAWGKELDNLFQAATDIKTADIDVTNLDLSAYFGSDDTVAKTRRASLEAALESINSCAILYRALPIKINDAITSTSTSLGGIDTTKANTFYKGKGLTGLPYDDSEISSLTWIIYDSSHTSFSTTAIKTLDADSTIDLLGQMADSHIFNSLSEEKKASLGQYGLTIFQDLLSDTLTGSAEIKKVYYRATSPKDLVATDSIASNYSLYNSSDLAKGKASYYTITYFPAVGSDAYNTLIGSGTTNPNVKTILGEPEVEDSTSLRAFIKNIQVGDVADAMSNNDLNSLDASTLSKVLANLNGNVLLMDCVPNSIAKFISESYTGYTAFSFSLASPYFAYWLNTDGSMKSMTVSNANYSLAYPDNEISVLSTLLKTMSSNQTLFNNISSTTIGSSEITSINSMLTGLYDSYIFYSAGAYEGIKDGSTTYLPNSAGSDDSKPADDLTIFEQAFYTIYDKSSLASRSTSSAYDSLTYAFNTNVNDTNRQLFKLHDSIAACSLLDRSGSGTFSWTKEIAAFSGTDGLLNKALSNHFLDSGMNFGSGTGLNFATMSADLLKVFAFSLNGLTVINDIVPYELGSLLSDTIKLSTYSDVTRTISNSTSTYAISGLGAITSLSVTTTGTLTATYSYDGTTYGTLDIATIASKKPFYVKLASTSVITSITLTYDTSDFFLSQQTTNDFERQAIYGDTTSSPLLTLQAFAAAAKDSSGNYVSFENPSSAITTVTAMFDKVLNLINDPNGFYQRGYAEDYSSKRDTPSFRSRAYVLYNILNFTSGIYTVNLGQYLKRDYSSSYMGIAAVFTSASYDVTSESNYFKNCLTLATTAEAIIGNNQTALTGMDQIHTKMAALASDTSYSLGNELSSSYTSSSQFGKQIAAGQLASLLSQVVTYSKSGSYYTGVAPINAPAYTKDTVLTTHSADITSTASGLLAYADSMVGESTVLEAYTNIVSFYGDIGASKYLTDYASAPTATSFPVSEAAKTLFTNRDSSSFSAKDKQLFGYFYLGVEYDFFVARHFYHDSNTLLGWSAVNYPDPFLTGFSYATAGASIATA